MSLQQMRSGVVCIDQHIKIPPNFTDLEGCFRYSGIKNDPPNRRFFLWRVTLISTNDYNYSVFIKQLDAGSKCVQQGTEIQEFQLLLLPLSHKAPKCLSAQYAGKQSL